MANTYIIIFSSSRQDLFRFDFSKLYDNDEIVFALDDHGTKFILCRASYSIDENEIVHVKDDSKSKIECSDVLILLYDTNYSDDQGLLLKP